MILLAIITFIYIYGKIYAYLLGDVLKYEPLYTIPYVASVIMWFFYDIFNLFFLAPMGITGILAMLIDGEYYDRIRDSHTKSEVVS